MTIVEFYERKMKLIQDYQASKLDRTEANQELSLINAEAKQSNLPVALLTFNETLNEKFTGGDGNFEHDDESYEESYEDSYEESYDDY